MRGYLEGWAGGVGVTMGSATRDVKTARGYLLDVELTDDERAHLAEDVAELIREAVALARQIDPPPESGEAG